MNDLLTIQQTLQNALLQDPLHQLAYLTVLLDPLWQTDDSSDDPLHHALLIARSYFPEVYVQAVQALHNGISVSQLDNLLCKSFSEAGIPVDNIDWVPHGIPLPAYGVDLYEDEPNEQVLPLLELFGVAEGEVPDEAPDLAVMLFHHLHKLESPLCQIGWAVGWLWGVTGNSSCDLSVEQMYEYEPLTWDAENIDFARELIAEAEEIMAEVTVGLDYLSQPEALNALRKWIQSARKLYKKTYPKGGNIAHDKLCQLADQLKLDGSALARSAL